MKTKISHKIVSLTFGVLVISFATVFYAFAAWINPQLPPPAGNVEPPVNIGSTTQYKSGALGIGGIFTAYSKIIAEDVIVAKNSIEIRDKAISSRNPGWGGQTKLWMTLGTAVIEQRDGFYDYDNSGTLIWNSTDVADALSVQSSKITGPLFSVTGVTTPSRIFGVNAEGTVCINNDCRNAWPSGGTGGGGGVSGTGNQNYLSKFLSSASIGNSQIYDDGTNVGIGVGSGAIQKLDVLGYVRGRTGLCINTDCRTAWPSGGGTGGIGGGGSVGFIPRFTSSQDIANSVLYQSQTGPFLGIGNTNPSYALDVSGDINAKDSLCIRGNCKTAWPSSPTIDFINVNESGGLIFSNYYTVASYDACVLSGMAEAPLISIFPLCDTTQTSSGQWTLRARGAACQFTCLNLK